MPFLSSRSIALGALLLCAPAVAAAFDFDAAMRAAESHPMVRERAAMAVAARQRVGMAGAWPEPMAEAGLINVPVTGQLDMDPMTMRMLGLRQRVPLSDARGLARAAAREEYASSEAGHEVARLDVLAGTWEAYADAYFADSRAAHTREHVRDMEQLIDAAQARYRAGRSRMDDVLRAQAERARTLADVARDDAEAASARARLESFTGVALAPDDTLAPPPAPRRGWTAAEWPASAWTQHPSLLGYDADARAADAGAKSAARMAWPDLELGASYGKRGRLADGTTADDMFSATVGVMLPLYPGGRGGPEAGERRAMADAARASRANAERELKSRFLGALARGGAAARAERLYRDTIVVAQRKVIDVAWSSYVAGTGDLSGVLGAHHELYAAEVAWLQARQDVARAQAQLFAVTRIDGPSPVLPPSIAPGKRVTP